MGLIAIKWLRKSSSYEVDNFTPGCLNKFNNDIHISYHAFPLTYLILVLIYGITSEQAQGLFINLLFASALHFI